MTRYRRCRCVLCGQLIPGEQVVYRIVKEGWQRPAPVHEACRQNLRREVGQEHVWLRRRRYPCQECEEPIERWEEAVEVEHYRKADKVKGSHALYAHADCAYENYEE